MDSSTWSDAQALAYIASYADLRRVLGADPVAARTHYAQAGAAERRTISFDALGYVASYGDLRSAFGTDAAAAARHYIQAGAAEGRKPSFDAYGYLASYADLRAAFGADAAAAARHFILAGAAEGRTMSFDAFGYLASYADLRAAFGSDTSAAARHYVTTGAAEGRKITFDGLSYIASYSDLRAVFGADAAAAARHFVVAGAAEGRKASFDGLSYIASYADLRAAFGTNADAAVRHFIQVGAAERRAITFDPVAYLISNPDLIAAGLGVQGATRHWILNGVREGRSAAGSFGTEQTGHDFAVNRALGGEIDRAGDRDWFRLDLASGQGVTFDLTMANGSGVLSIRDADGRAVPTGPVSGTQTSFSAPSTGTFYLLVSAAGTAAGSYALSAKDFYTVPGTFGADTLTGTDGKDLIRALDGDDVLNGRGGADVLEGGGGFDQLNGGAGDDLLYGNNAANVGFDASYDNLTDDQGGSDQLFGQDGNDYLSVFRYDFNGPIAAGAILLDGGSGDDNLIFGASGRFLDTVTLRGGAGNDTIEVGSVLKSVINAGDGNDRVTIGMTGGDQTITLGAGADVLTLAGNTFAFAVGNPTQVTDLQIGVDAVNLDQFLAAALQGWDPSGNPFASGHLKLVQSGADTLLLLDRDGGAAPGYGPSTLLTFVNSTASSFTNRDLGYAPDGSSGSAQTIIGTFGADTLTGADGPDIIRGLDGDDKLYGRAGADLLEGGLGADQLSGGLGDDLLYGNNAANIGSDFSYDSLFDDQGGNDQLFGQDGNDYLSVTRYDFGAPTPASNVLLDGGQGDDNLYFRAGNRRIDTVTLRGGAGADTISVDSVLKSTVDAGDGNDRVTIGATGGDQTITLGSGLDVLALDGLPHAFTIGSPIRVTDFQVAADVLDLDAYLAATLQGWERGTNPFASGHLKLVQSGADALLQLDRDGSAVGGYSLDTLLTFANSDAAAFTSRELGDAPDGSPATGQTIPGGFGPDMLTGTNGADVIRGLDGDDKINGRAGADLLEGGAGADQLDGGLGDDVLYGNNAADTGVDFGYDQLIDNQGGNDQLFGQGGGDYLSVSRYAFNSSPPASTVLLDGGAGDDTISFGANDRFLDTVTVRGGSGADSISVGSVLRSVIDAGEGNDRVGVTMSSGDQTITLGAGADTLSLDMFSTTFAMGGPTRVTDFQVGADALSLDQYLRNALQGWDRASNPFDGGFLKLVQSGSDTLLQLDRDGGVAGYSFATLITLSNTNAASFTAKELGYAPAVSTAASEQSALAIDSVRADALFRPDHFSL